MIGKITRGARVGDIAAYLHGPGKANEHEYAGQLGGAVIGGNLGLEGERSGKYWAPILRKAAATRTDIKKPIWQASLRCAPNERRFADHEWADAAQLVAEKMGFAEHPWVAVRHADDHIHIVVARVTDDGEVWHAKNDYRSLQAARAAVEREFHLEQTRVRSAPGAKRPADYRVKQGERARGLTADVPPSRVRLAARVRAAVEVATGLGRGRFEQALDALGVLWRRNEASTGKISGYSYAERDQHDEDGKAVWFKASQLDRSLSWSRVEKLVAPAASTPAGGPLKRRLLESDASFRSRESDVAEKVIANTLSSRLASAKTRLAADFSELERWWSTGSVVNPRKIAADRERARFASAVSTASLSFEPLRSAERQGALVRPAVPKRLRSQTHQRDA
jgi:hypothetical protein